MKIRDHVIFGLFAGGGMLFASTVAQHLPFWLSICNSVLVGAGAGCLAFIVNKSLE